MGLVINTIQHHLQSISTDIDQGNYVSIVKPFEMAPVHKEPLQCIVFEGVLFLYEVQLAAIGIPAQHYSSRREGNEEANMIKTISSGCLGPAIKPADTPHA